MPKLTITLQTHEEFSQWQTILARAMRSWEPRAKDMPPWLLQLSDRIDKAVEETRTPAPLKPIHLNEDDGHHD